MWIEGSWAEDYRDEFSDVDVWFDIDDGNEAQVFAAIKKTLQTFGELDVDLDMGIAHPHLEHHVYHVKGMNEYQTFDVNLQLHSRNFVFTKGMHEISVILDKDNTIKWQNLDKQQLGQDLGERAKYLRQFFALGQPLIEKQIKRGHYIEAYGYYFKWCLMPLVELLRIKYCPAKTDFWIKHIERDLPKKVVAQIEPLFKPTSLDDIGNCTNLASKLIGSL